MNKQLDEPLKDKVYVLTMTVEEDEEYCFYNKLFINKKDAWKELLNWKQEELDNKIGNGWSIDRFSTSTNWTNEDKGLGRLTDGCTFWYDWYIKEEVVNE